MKRNWQRYVRRRLSLPKLRPEREDRVVRELAAQLEDFYRDARARGLNEEEAEALARRQIPDWKSLAAEIARAERRHAKGVLERLADSAEDASGPFRGLWRLFADLPRDVHFSLRQFVRRPSFAVIAVLTIALAVGCGTAVYSVVYAVLLRPLPYPDSDRLAVIALSWPTGRFWLSEKDVLTLRKQSTLFEGFAVLDEASATLLGDRQPERLNVALTSSNLLSVLGVGPAVGRFFSAEEEAPKGPAVAVISHGLWQSRFGGASDILEKTLLFDGSRKTRIVGVMPRNFRMVVSVNSEFHRKADVWYPLQVDYQTIDRGKNLIVLARLKEGSNWRAAQLELDRIAKTVFTDPGSQNTFRAFPLQEDAVRNVRQPLVILLAATGFLLLIACANVANLLLARGAIRRHELAVRTALGATRFRLTRQSLTESGLLALLGGGCGIVVAWFGVRAAVWLLPPQFPRSDTIELNGAVLGLSLALSALAGLLFGAAPAFRASRARAHAALGLAIGGRNPGGASRFLRKALVVGEMAASLTLLLGGALLVRSFLELQKDDPGYNPANTLTFTISLPSKRYPSAERRAEFFQTLQKRIAQTPGVESVGGNLILPFGRSLFKTTFTFLRSEGQPLTFSALMRPALPGYLEALQARLLAGRFFNAEDAPNGEKVAIVDQTVAESVWPRENPIGQKLVRGGDPNASGSMTVVGVVENMRLTQLIGDRERQVFVPAGQHNISSISFVVRTQLDPPALLDPIRAHVREMDPNLPLYDVGQLAEVLEEQRAPQRVTSLLMALFAAIALTVSLIGVFGVVSTLVIERTREIGIRLALGAQQRNIRAMVLGSGLKLAAIGAAVGIAGAAALTRTIESLLYRVSAADPWNYALVATLLILSVAAACYLPARRAMRVDPLKTLRCE